MLVHKRAFGAHSGRKSKLLSREAYGPYRILAVDFKRGRLKVELGEISRRGSRLSSRWSTDARLYSLERPWQFDVAPQEEWADMM